MDDLAVYAIETKYSKTDTQDPTGRIASGLFTRHSDGARTLLN